MPLKIVTVSLGDIPGETHTSHSSKCILGFHSLRLRHLQTHLSMHSYAQTQAEIKHQAALHIHKADNHSGRAARVSQIEM